MAQTKYTSTRTDPLQLYAAAMLLVVVTSVGLILEWVSPHSSTDLVKWRKLSEYQSEAERTKKPVLFVFSAAWCGPCRRMEREAFGRRKIADYINKTFIPVLVMDVANEQGKNPTAIEKLKKTCAVEAFPTLIVVPSNLLDGSTKDIYSTGSRVEYDMVLRMVWGWWVDSAAQQDRTFSQRYQNDYLSSYYDRVPAKRGYAGINDLEDYFWKCKIWHRMELSRGKIAWQSPNKIGTGTKPTLIALVEDGGYSSDAMRLGLFENDSADDYINKNFLPVLLEFKRGKNSVNDPNLTELKNRYKVKYLPALVVLNQGKQPIVQDGFTSVDLTQQFVHRAVDDWTDGQEKRNKPTR